MQVEVLLFLVNNVQKELDFAQLKEAFRQIDTGNTGILSNSEMRAAFENFKLP